MTIIGKSKLVAVIWSGKRTLLTLEMASLVQEVHPGKKMMKVVSFPPQSEASFGVWKEIYELITFYIPGISN